MNDKGCLLERRPFLFWIDEYELIELSLKVINDICFMILSYLGATLCRLF